MKSWGVCGGVSISKNPAILDDNSLTLCFIDWTLSSMVFILQHYFKKIMFWRTLF
jgi:hypothetical protein